VDGETISIDYQIERNFNQIQITGDDFKLEADVTGQILIKNNKIIVDL